MGTEGRQTDCLRRGGSAFCPLELLALWAERARNPAAWHDALLIKAKVGPEGCEPYVRGQIAHVVSTLDGAKRVAQAIEPIPATWLCCFDPIIRFAKPGRTGSLMEGGPHFDPFAAYGLDSDPVPAKLILRIASLLNEIFPRTPGMHSRSLAQTAKICKKIKFLRYAVIGLSIRHDLPIESHTLDIGFKELRISPPQFGGQPRKLAFTQTYNVQSNTVLRIKRWSSTAIIRKAWRYQIESWRSRRDDFSQDYFQLVAAIKNDGWSSATIRAFGDVHRPYIKVGSAFHGSPRAPDVSVTRLGDLMHLDVKYPHHNDEQSITEEFLPSVARELRLNLEFGSALEQELGGYGLHTLVSVAPDDGDDPAERTHKYGINIPLFEYLKIFRRLLEVDLSAAKREALAWRNLKGPVAAHFKIWSCSDAHLTSVSEIARILRTISREEFWEGSHQRDLLMALEKRWNQLPLRNRRSIEQRLLRGRKRWKGESLKDFKERRASAILGRIHYLHGKGCGLSFDLNSVTEQLRADYPEWRLEWASKAAFSAGMRTGWVKTDTRSDDLLNQPLAEILDTAAKLSGRSPDELFLERDPYAGLCASKPVRAFAALIAAGKAGKYPRSPWHTFLNHENRKHDRARFVILIASRLSLLPDSFLNDLLRPVSDWLLRTHQIILPDHRKVLDRLWLRIFGLLQKFPQSEERGSQQPDWATEALNSTVGHLAQVLMSDPAIKLKPGDRFPDCWKVRCDELLSFSGDRRRQALAIFCHNLVWLFAIDPEWVTKAFLPVIEQQSADSDAFWAGFFWGAKVPQEQLYLQMKPALLRLAHRNSDTRRRHAEILAGIILAGWGSKIRNGAIRAISDAEMTAVLVDADDDFRTQLIWHLENWSKESASHWVNDTVVLLTQVWPKQIAAKTPRVSAKLAELALAQGDRFPSYVNYVLPLVVPIDQDYINLPVHRHDEEGNLVEKYPKQMLALLHAVLTDNARQWPYGISEVLDRIAKADPRLHTDSRLIKLNRIRTLF